MTSFRDINPKGIGKVLSDGNLTVPPFQRSYAWEAQHVNDLFQDLASAIDEGATSYFLGSIVLVLEKSGEPYYVADGQQRLATTAILLAAIRDHFDLASETKRARTIEQEYLFCTDLESADDKPRIRLNETDHDYFLKRILKPPNAPERQTVKAMKPSHKRIHEAAELAKRHVDNLAKVNRKPIALINWVKFLKEHASVISVTVDSYGSAFTIFETLNDRGLDLAISDLLKNFLFSLADERISEVQLRWASMIGVLEFVEREAIVVTFIRHFWSSKHGLTRDKDLYDSIKRTITSKKAAVDFAEELSNGASSYAAILTPNHEKWDRYGPSARGDLAILNSMGVSQVRPLLLATLDKFTVPEFNKALRLFLSWSVRFSICGGMGSGTMERYYSERAMEVRRGAIKNAGALRRAMKDVVPSDADFETAFSRASVSKASLARYYLVALEKQYSPATEPELVPNTNEEQITLEHILPQAPSKAWAHIDAETTKAYIKRLGNLALMKKEGNNMSGNDGFTAKKTLYGKSNFKLTAQLAEYKEWTTAQIDERQANLAKLAVATWPNKT